jgi:hypothetical protein
MSIREECAARRTSVIYCVESEDRPVAMLRVCLWQEMEWVLPWSRFEVATFQHEDGSERIEIVFTHHRVVVVGKNLRETMNDIRKFEVRCLRNIPPSLHPSLIPTEPLVEKLEVYPLNGPKQGPTNTQPF